MGVIKNLIAKILFLIFTLYPHITHAADYRIDVIDQGVQLSPHFCPLDITCNFYVETQDINKNTLSLIFEIRLNKDIAIFSVSDRKQNTYVSELNKNFILPIQSQDEKPQLVRIFKPHPLAQKRGDMELQVVRIPSDLVKNLEIKITSIQ